LVPVKLAPYDPDWAHLYEAEAEYLLDTLTGVSAIEHVGSTSVPGLAAKPTIDIAIGVASLALPDGAAAAMERLGYHYGGSHDLPQHVFRKGERVPWRFLVHIVEYGGPMWRDFLTFRDYLRRNPTEAVRYEQLKRSLLAERSEWYSGRDKEPFIRPIHDSHGA
jgi:GrpB-like predicted nucleotidyltransferase (UPF0157 family)